MQDSKTAGWFTTLFIPTEAPAARSRLHGHVLFATGTLLLIVSNERLISELVAFSRTNPTASHLLLVPLVTIGLIWHGRRDIFSSAGAFRPLPTAFAVTAIAVTWVLSRSWTSARPADALSARMTVLVVAWTALFLAVYGPSTFRRALFPLLFAAFMIPIPNLLLAPIVAFLKKGSSDVVAGLLVALGTPFHRDHFTFALPRLTFRIADECSGIRSSIALLLTALLAGYFYLRPGWRRAALVLTVVPLAIIKNGIRIVTLSLLAEYVNPSFIDGELHHDGGILFFLMTLALLLPILVLLQRSEAARAAEVVRP